MKRTPAGYPLQPNTTSKASDVQKKRSSTGDDAAAPILIFVIACLILAILILRSPDTVVLTADQISLMPCGGLESGPSNSIDIDRREHISRQVIDRLTSGGAAAEDRASLHARKLVPAFGRLPWRLPAERGGCQTSKPDGAWRAGLNSTTEYRCWVTDPRDRRNGFSRPAIDNPFSSSRCAAERCEIPAMLCGLRLRFYFAVRNRWLCGSSLLGNRSDPWVGFILRLRL